MLGLEVPLYRGACFKGYLRIAAKGNTGPIHSCFHRNIGLMGFPGLIRFIGFRALDPKPLFRGVYLR